MVIPVPNDPDYIAMMRGLIDTLTWSRSFQLHRTEQAARQVADTWQAAFESQLITFQDCGGTQMFQLRQNPSNLCQLQQSLDGGETWTLAFDYAEAACLIPTYPPFPDSGTGNIDAASNVIGNIWFALVDLAKALCGSTQAEYITQATALMQQYSAGFSADTLLGDIYDTFCAMTEEEQQEFQDRESYCSQFNELSNCANIQGVFDLLDCLNELLVEWLDDTNTDLMTLLNKAAATLTGTGMQAAANAGGGGGGAAFGGSCLWEHEFTWATAEGWSPMEAYGTTMGAIVGGEWYNNVLTPYPFGNRMDVSIYIVLPRLTTIKSIETRYRTGNASGTYYINASSSTSVQTDYRVYDIVANNDSTETRLWEGSVDMRVIRIGVQLGPASAFAAIENTIITGVGINPFV